MAFTGKRLQAIEYLSQGYSQEATSKKVGVHRKSIQNWLKDDEFCLAIQQRQFETLEEDRGKLRRLRNKALKLITLALDPIEGRRITTAQRQIALEILRCQNIIKDPDPLDDLQEQGEVIIEFGSRAAGNPITEILPDDPDEGAK